MAALRNQEERIVEVELGTYDDIRSSNFDKIAMPLGRYLDWLEETAEGTVGGRQLYLAQWVGREQVDAVGAEVPRALQPLLEDGRVDLYLEATFLGPTGAVTPFHYDPYMNLFHLQASADPRKFAKHVTLLPPSISPWLQTASRGSSVMGNTSQIKARLRRCVTDDSDDSFECQLSSDLSDVAMQAVAEHVKVCVLREGETLFIPRGWWHRVENVSLSRDPGPTAGWTAGVSWWFLPRNNAGPVR
ncbi:hypothetical protein PHLGIDRAFT_126381 [Phlebiopsis gigantea 11061_1 CR5-6]|uniref:JmjC domain-containing protein n=1 Tax=Phlebiopsis gigantea (strain 11061_1 CR5-6) TaxID=745531 RepID=A0A0C3NVI8_PHLG1|nr:hypothetical protein PHLGIDRAFT_126381 [Phlebiopsis gigantea 11061_1 CR5-6]